MWSKKELIDKQAQFWVVLPQASRATGFQLVRSETARCLVTPLAAGRLDSAPLDSAAERAGVPRCRRCAPQAFSADGTSG